MTSEIQVKRIYAPALAEDGLRILVDRLWPRGMSKANAKVDLWLKGATPSHDLRRWFHAHGDQYDEFTRRYQQELETVPSECWRSILKDSPDRITLVTAVKQIDHSHVPILQAFIQRQRKMSRNELT